MARPVKTAQQMADAWATGMASAGPAYTAGTSAVTESPMAKAAQNLDKYLANTSAAVSSGRMAAALNASTIQDWQGACRAKAGNLGMGASLAKPKFLRKAQGLQQTNQAIRDAVSAMPKGGMANALARFQKAVTMQMEAAGRA